MSTAPPPGTAPAPLTPPRSREITLVSHSMLFYWWPIWVLGFFMFAKTYFEDTRLAIVPDGSDVTKLDAESNEKQTVYRLAVVTPTKSLENAAKSSSEPGTDKHVFPTRMSEKAWMGPVFCVVLLLTVVITNVPLRGLWSFLVILLLLILALVIAMIPNGWDNVSKAVFGLHIYINMAGYLFIATTVLILWVVSTFIFDQRTYMKITPGRVQVCEHIGAAVRAFDTTGMAFEKQRDDIFRHWLLGFFSGDLIVRTSGAERETIRMPNVLWISWRLEEVQQLLAEKAVVSHTP